MRLPGSVHRNPHWRRGVQSDERGRRARWVAAVAHPCRHGGTCRHCGSPSMMTTAPVL
ncbi:hypothetical protein APASM_5636 [Actinosynnema pretiosum subsp. pretiosum]|nr:hypothetical protein APASM_5636 [Actinosynnema pretiosum subsp. pretiosum]